MGGNGPLVMVMRDGDGGAAVLRDKSRYFCKQNRWRTDQMEDRLRCATNFMTCFLEGVQKAQSEARQCVRVNPAAYKLYCMTPCWSALSLCGISALNWWQNSLQVCALQSLHDSLHKKMAPKRYSVIRRSWTASSWNSWNPGGLNVDNHDEKDIEKQRTHDTREDK